MHRSWSVIAGVVLVAVAWASDLAFLGRVSVARAQVQGLDDLDASRGGRAGCPGGYVEGLGCSGQRLPIGPGIQDSDQGWQRDWQSFGAGAPGWPVYGFQGGGYRGDRPPMPPRGFGPPRGLGAPFSAPR